MFDINQIDAANPEKTHEVDVLFKNEGDERGVTLRAEYRALTPEIMSRGSVPAQLAGAVKSLKRVTDGGELEALTDGGEEIKPTFEFFASRPVPFLNTLSDAVVGDYFPK